MNILGRSIFRASISLFGLAFGGEMLMAQAKFELHAPDPAEQLDSLLLQGRVAPPQARQPKPQQVLPLGETVSVAELRLPAPAAKELRLSLKRFHSGDLSGSAKHLEKAISIDETIPVAHHYLGICYLGLGEYEKAISEFKKASAQDPRLIQSRIGLSEALFIVKRYAEAEAAARQLDPINPTARYLLGRIWAAEERDDPQVFEMLRASQSQFPQAHLVLASLLLKHGATDDAISELREYLNWPVAPDKDKVVCMVQRLSKPGGTSTCALN